MHPNLLPSLRIQTGFSGRLLVVFLGLGVGPASSAQPGLDATAPPAGFKTVDATPLVARIDGATTEILEAFNRRDREKYLAAFAPEPLVLPDGAVLTTGRAGVAQMYLQAPEGLVYEPMLWADRRVFQVGAWVVETGLVGFQFRRTSDKPISTDPRQALTIWEEGGDGSLRVKLLAWNRLAAPGELYRGTPPRAYATVLEGGAYEDEGDFAAVLEAETVFHQAFEKRQVAEAAPFYAERATLIVPRKLPLYGRSAILNYLEALPPGEFATKVERQVAHVEGSESFVLVVNLFRWTFEPPEPAAPVRIAGKGVHLWQRNEDGAWRILFDLPNASEPTG